MAAISSLYRYFNACRVFHTPTTLAGDPPYGGTELGATRGIRVYSGGAARACRDYLKGTTIRVVQTVADPRIEFFFRQWDPDALPKLYQNTAAGATGTIVKNPTPGASAASRAVKLLLASKDQAGLFALIQRAYPSEADSEALAMELGLELNAAAVFFVGEPETGATPAVQIGYRGDLTI